MSCPVCNGHGMVVSVGDWKENGGWEVCPNCYPPEEKAKGWFGRFWQRFLAYWHISDVAVCEQSKGMGLIDYHDYLDDVMGTPVHFHELTCKRCGKKFTI